MRRRDVIIKKGIAFILAFALAGSTRNFSAMTAMAAETTEAVPETAAEYNIGAQWDDQTDSEVQEVPEEEAEEKTNTKAEANEETRQESVEVPVEEREPDQELDAQGSQEISGKDTGEEQETRENPELLGTIGEETQTEPNQTIDLETLEFTEDVVGNTQEDMPGSDWQEIKDEIKEDKQEEETNSAISAADLAVVDQQTLVAADSASSDQQVPKSVQTTTASELETEEVIEDEALKDNPNEDIALYSVIDDVLKEDAAKYVCEELKARIEAVASGDATNTVFMIELGDPDVVEWLVKDNASGFSKVIHALLNDCSYDLFWFDKTQQYSLSYRKTTVTITLPVAKKYQKNTNCMTNASLIKASKAAEGTAQNIVKKTASKNDKEKLKTYMQEICNLTSYNHTALSQKDDPNRDTDAWQAVNVFTGKKAVCEGYSKAFRYLCDSSEFSSAVDCYTVTGTMQGSGQIIGGGDHMWNIVVIGSKSYLVDVTNCDSLSSDSLFMATPVSGSVEKGYVFKINGGTVTYKYDKDTLELFGKDSAILKLATASAASSSQKPATPSTQKPTTSKPSTSTTKRPTTGRPSTSTTSRPTTDRPSTSVTNRPTTSRPSTTVTNRPTTSRPSTTVTNRPTTSRPSTTVTNRPTTSRPSTTVTNRPTTSRPSTTVTNRPTTSRPSTSVSNRPTTSRPSTTVTNRPTTSRPSTTVTNRPTTSRPSTTVTNRPTTSRPSTTVTNRPTTSRPSTTVTNRPTTSRPSMSTTNCPTTSRPSTSATDRLTINQLSIQKTSSLTLPKVSRRPFSLVFHLNKN